MKILDRYILSEFTRIFLLALVTLMVFYEMVVFLDTSGYFVKFGATADEITRFMLFKIPVALFHVTPICVLLASLLTMGLLSRYSELVAMESAGVSFFRVCAPILLAGAVMSVLSFLNSEHIFHLAARESNRVYYEEIREEPRKSLFTRDRFWYKSDGGSIWNIGHINTKEKIIRDVSIFMFAPGGSRVEKRVTASEGRLEEGKWVLLDVKVRLFDASGRFEERRAPRLELPMSAIPDKDLDKVKLYPEEMNLGQIREYIRDIRARGYDATRYVVDMHAKIAFPLISLVMPLIAIPMGVRSSRAGGALVGIAVAVVIGGLFWFSFSMGVAFGHAGKLPPVLAVYGPHVVFAAAGLMLLLSRRHG